MLIKATRLHPGVPLQVYVGSDVGAAVLWSVAWTTKTSLAITEARFHFVLLSFSNEGHCPSPPSSTLGSICIVSLTNWPLI